MTAEGPDEVEDGVTDAVEEVTDAVEEVTVVLEVADVTIFEIEGFVEVVDDVIPAL